MNTDALQGLVYKKSIGTYYVKTDEGQLVTCTISSRLRKQLIYPMRDPSSLGHYSVASVEDIRMLDPVAVGDRVSFITSGPDSGHITGVLPRTSKLTRRAAENEHLEQVIVANSDQVITVIAAANPKPKWNLLDRYLASAEASDLPAIIAITKVDLVQGTKAEREVLAHAEEYASIGYRVILTSAAKGEGIDDLRDALRDKMSTLIGKSGVGKTSLLNALQPGLGLRVNEINTKIDKGRHTTTSLEMYPLAFGGHLVDTPGMKVFGLWDIEPEEVALLYREMAPYVGTCKFGLSCTHEHEPGCAITRAVGSGAISKHRYQSYLRLIETLDDEDAE